MPIEQHDIQLTLPAPGWLVSATKADGIVRIAAHGPDHASLDHPSFDAPEYARHAYSTHTAFDIENANPLDSHVALLTTAGRASHRRPVHPIRIDGRIAISRSRTHWLDGEAPIPWRTEGKESWTLGPWLTTASVLNGPWEVRLARVAEPGPWRLRIGGWAIAAAEPPTAEANGSTATSRTDNLTSTVSGRHGLLLAGYTRTTDRNPLGRHAAIPWVATEDPITPGQIYAAVVTLSGVALTGDVDITIAGDHVTITWPDGERDELTLDQ